MRPTSSTTNVLPRGGGGTPQRETSLLQLIYRSVDHLLRAGKEHVLRHGRRLLRIFDHRAEAHLLNQCSSFNSTGVVSTSANHRRRRSKSQLVFHPPPWTPDGLASDGTARGTDLQGRSGAGSNLSRSRSSKALLSVRRDPRPVRCPSMRGATPRAGTISQVRWRHPPRREDGGSRRRSPDIESSSAKCGEEQRSGAPP